MKLTTAFSLATLLLAGCMTPPPQQQPHRPLARVIWFGTLEEAPSTATAPLSDADRTVLIDRTDVVPLELGLRFGIRLEPEAGADLPRTFKVIWRIPAPGIPDPRSGALKTEEILEGTTEKCLPRCRQMWSFDAPSELLPGTWSIEVHGFSEKPIVQKFEAYVRPPRDPATNLEALSFETAERMVQQPPFAKARQLATLRPEPKISIRSMQLQVDSDLEGEPTRTQSTMRFRPLPGGLDYTSHTVTANGKAPALEEAFVGVYGAIAALRWNGTATRNGVYQNSIPAEIRLTEGALFDPNSAFTVLDAINDGSLRSNRCEPVSQLDASQLHRSLPGKATVFACADADPDFSSVVWYLHDAQRYVMHEVRVRDKVQARFTILDVVFDSRER